MCCGYTQEMADLDSRIAIMRENIEKAREVNWPALERLYARTLENLLAEQEDKTKPF